MAEIHLHTPSGETSVHPGERVAELLQAGALSPDTLYWRDGMAEWRPLAELQPVAPAVEPLSERAPLSLPESAPLPQPEPVPPSAPKPLPSPEAVLEPLPKPAASPDPEASTPKKPSVEFGTGPIPETAPVSSHAPSSAAPGNKQARTPGRNRFRFRRNPEPLTTIVQVLLAICLVITALELANGLVRYSSLTGNVPLIADSDGGLINSPARDAVPGGSEVSSVATDANSAFVSLDESDDIGWLLLWLGWGACTLLIIPYFMWLYRTVQNSRNFSSIMRFKPEWSVWCYFIPPMNFFRPCQVMQEIWRISNNPRTWHNDRYSTLVGLWWTLTLSTVVLALATGLNAFEAESHAAQVNTSLLFIALKIVQLAWFGVFLAMVTMIIQKQIRVARGGRRKAEQGDDA
jgi:hypothetical protein